MMVVMTMMMVMMVAVVVVVVVVVGPHDLALGSACPPPRLSSLFLAIDVSVCLFLHRIDRFRM